MTRKPRGLLGKVTGLLTRFPAASGVSPEVFFSRWRWLEPQPGAMRLAFQSVPDKFYFLLFGGLCASLRSTTSVYAEIIVVRSISGAIGTGWLANLKRSSLLSLLGSGPWLRAYSGLVHGVAYRCATWRHPWNDMSDWLQSKRIWQQLQQQRGLLSMKVSEIEIADLLIDSYLRFKPAPAFDVNDPFVRQLIWQAMRDVRQATLYFKRNRPCWYLTSYTTYLEHGIPVRVALQQGVTVWSFGNFGSFGKQLTNESSFHTLDFSRYRTDFEALGAQDQKRDSARIQLESRLTGGIDAATSYMRKSAYKISSELVPEGLNGAVVIFLHDFYDSPHVYPDLIFDDFWQWVCFTIDTLRATNARFFLKPHPNQIALSDDALKLLGTKYPDLHWVPQSITNVQLAKAGIACGVTVYGTVAHELAYLGVPSIACARHPHHAFDFCRTAKTQQEYARLLDTFLSRPLPVEELQRQALEFYYMHNLHGDEDQIALRSAFLNFWKTCREETVPVEQVLQSFNALVVLPAFEGFVQSMAASRCTGAVTRGGSPSSL